MAEIVRMPIKFEVEDLDGVKEVMHNLCRHIVGLPMELTPALEECLQMGLVRYNDIGSGFGQFGTFSPTYIGRTVNVVWACERLGKPLPADWLKEPDG